MQTLISGQQIDVGDSLTEYAKTRMEEMVNKYFEKVISSEIHFSKDGPIFNCSLVLNDGTGRHHILNSRESSGDIYDAFDTALNKLKNQLIKSKSKLNDKSDRVKLSEIPLEDE